MSSYLTSWNNQVFNIDYSIGFIGFKKFILDKYGEDVDVFIHGWVDDIKYKKRIVEIYKPVKYIIEIQKEFNEEINKIEKYGDILHEYYNSLNKNIAKNLPLTYKDFFQNRYSLCYSIKRTTSLMEEYSQETGVTYDMVINSRFDILIQQLDDISNLDPNIFYITNKKKNHCDDNLIITGQNMAIQFSKIYDYLEYFFNSWKKELVDRRFNKFSNKFYNKYLEEKRYSIHTQIPWYLSSCGISLKHNVKHLLNTKALVYKYVDKNILQKEIHKILIQN